MGISPAWFASSLSDLALVTLTSSLQCRLVKQTALPRSQLGFKRPLPSVHFLPAAKNDSGRCHWVPSSWLFLPQLLTTIVSSLFFWASSLKVKLWRCHLGQHLFRETSQTPFVISVFDSLSFWKTETACLPPLPLKESWSLPRSESFSRS